MFKIHLKNNVSFNCDENSTIFEAAKTNGVVLEHSCLAARCRSCIVKILDGETVNNQEELVLSGAEREEKFVLSCNAKPISDLSLDIDDLDDIVIYKKKIIPSKIQNIQLVNDEILKLELRFPPSADFKYNAGQYVNLIYLGIKRSYSIANFYRRGSTLLFYIKNYKKGLMSEYWFKKAKLNDLLRVEGPLGTFFFRDSDKDNIVFLATGTGVAPIKSILDDLDVNKPERIENKKIWVVVGARFQQDLFWTPKTTNITINYIPTLSRPQQNWKGEKGYVQDVVLKQKIDLKNTQVYACGSIDMINTSKHLFIDNGLEDNHFFADAFVQSN